MGAPPEVLAQARARTARPELIVLAHNQEAVDLFLGLSTQWRWVAGRGGTARIGLDYQAIPALLKLQAIPEARWPRLMESLQVMEAAALEAARAAG